MIPQVKEHVQALWDTIAASKQKQLREKEVGEAPDVAGVFGLWPFLLESTIFANCPRLDLWGTLWYISKCVCVDLKKTSF